MSVAAHGADVVVANSAYTAASISPGVNDRVRVVHNGVDLERFDPESIDRLAARERLGLGGSPDPVLSIIAQITPWKGQEEAIRATAELAQQGRPTTLLIAGAPKFTSAATRYDNIAYLSRLEGLVEELRLGDRVKFLGEIQDTPLVLSASDVVLVPSWAEPFGRTVIEAMAMATPVVATGVGGPNEIITHGHDGLLVPVRNPGALADAVAHLLSDGKLAAAIGDAARARARDFSLQEHVGAIVGLYRNGG
jgi:glycosyltransferase involved in cell wall biosynthesis